MRRTRAVIEKGAGWYDTWEEMYDALFIDDAVTGNGSGSYTFSAVRAAENAQGLVFDDGFIAEAQAVGYGIELFAESPETVDVIAAASRSGSCPTCLRGYTRAPAHLSLHSP